MCDKGDGSKGRDGANFVKLLAYWDEENKKVRLVSIGIDGAGNSSQEAAAGIDFSLLPFNHNDFRVVLIGQCTDAGGGGTGSSLYTDLCLRERVITVSEYKIGTCTLHALNLTSSTPIETLLGKSGLKARTTLQALFTVFNLTQ